MPTARYAFASGPVGGRIYAIGGFNGYSVLDVNEEYDPATDSWATKSPMPTERVALGVGVFGDEIYAIGGLQSLYALSTNEMYDPSTDSWSTMAEMPTPRYSLAIGSTSQGLYAIGGVDWFSSEQVKDDNEEYIPTPVGLKEDVTLFNDGKVLIFPTIFSEGIFLKIQRNFPNLKVSLFDGRGSCVFQKRLSNPSGVVKVWDKDLISLPAGLYLMQISVKDRPLTCKKVVKIK